MRKASMCLEMGRNFDDYPGFQPMRSWINTYAKDCRSYTVRNSRVIRKLLAVKAYRTVMDGEYILDPRALPALQGCSDLKILILLF